MGRIAEDIEKQLQDLTPKESARVKKVLSGILEAIDNGSEKKVGMMDRLFGGKPAAPATTPTATSTPTRDHSTEEMGSVRAVMHDPVSGLAPFYRRTLLKDVIPFWFPRCIDREHGGFLHCLDRDGTVVDTDKSVWAHGRMTWMLLSIYNTVEQKPEWLEWGKSGLKFIEDHCFDEDGRMFFHVTREGKPIRKRRYAFSECFASIAYGAHAKATGEERSATRATELFRQFLDWNFEPGKMPAKFTDVRPMTGIGPRMMAITTAQDLRENIGESKFLTETIDRNIAEIEKLFVKPDLRCVMENVSPSGEILDTFDGRTLNPGHAIEAAWFIMKEGDHRQSQPLIRLGCQILDWMWERGWDEEHGGLLYFRDVHGKPVQEYWHDMKFWWPHNEAIIATLMAWLLTGDDKYQRMHRQVHEWSFKTFADKEHGEWYGYAHRNGRISSPLKGNLWKSFFHHPRMLWVCWRLCQGWAEAKPPKVKTEHR
ncbi:MAG: N-acylglucosamine 2-epimerase [Limisphaerales bacterium]|jgi:N-acylglucosamine 2-epimerase